MTDERPKMPQIGDAAPEIDREATGGAQFVLGAHRDMWVVVYFYPRASTPG